MIGPCRLVVGPLTGPTILARISHRLTRTSRNQRGERGRCRLRRVEAANPSLTVGALTHFASPRGEKAR